MSKKSELPNLMARVLLLLPKATSHPTQRFVELDGETIDTKLAGLDHNGLSVVFHKANFLTPQPHRPPLAVTIHAGGKAVFRGFVDPENVAHSEFTTWRRGDWEAAVLQGVGGNA